MVLGAKTPFFTLSDTLLQCAHGLPEHPSPRENSRMIHPSAMRCVFLVLCTVVASCSTVSGSGRTQVNFYSAADDARIGQQAWTEVLSDPLVLKQGPKVERVQRIGNRIVAAARRLQPPCSQRIAYFSTSARFASPSVLIHTTVRSGVR